MMGVMPSKKGYTMKVLKRDSLPLGGFAGIKEHRLVVDQRIGGNANTWNGLGNFVYLADALYDPYGQTNMHPHHEIDIISVIVKGRVNHEGSLQNGQSLVENQVQVQRAGGEGFSHNEINPDKERSRMIQIWVLPENAGEPASYKLYNLEKGNVTSIYGGAINQTHTLDAHTILEVGILKTHQKISKKGEFMLYVTQGSGYLNGIRVEDGDLIRGEDFELEAIEDGMQIIIVTKR